MSVVRVPVERRTTPRLVTITELIDLYGYSERWWRYRISEGMPARRWGKRLRFNPAEVERWLEERYAS